MWKSFLGAQTFEHSVFTVSKVFSKGFTAFFWNIMYLASVNRHNPARL